MRRVACVLVLLPLLCGGAPPALLVLRAACRARDSAALDPLLPAPRALRLLPYRDTCGPGWREAVLREALHTMSSGSAVALVGWPGARVCAAISAAARGLGQRGPAECALGEARGSAVAWLAARLGWRRVLLPPAPSSECREAQREVQRALGTRAAPDPEPPDVVILCATTDAPPTGLVLLLYVEQQEHLPTATDLPLAREEPTHARTITSPRSVHRNNTTLTRKIRDVVRTRFETDLNGFKNSSNSNEDAEDFDDPESFLSRIGESFSQRDVLVLSEEELAGGSRPQRLYERVLSAVRDTERAEPALTTFHVYQRAARAATWSLTANLLVHSAPADEPWKWASEVRALNVTPHLDELMSWHAGGEVPAAATIALAALCALAGLVMVGSAALAVRWAAARRRRRRGGDVVLSAADFSFPADERRCVGEGMETMLSCWLQQLHEFGGPELGRPDLLQQQAAPSAPSSTCSVTRLAPDRRVRYKGDPVHVKPWDCAGATDLEFKRKAIDVMSCMRSLRHENINPFIGWVAAGGGPALVWDYCGRGSLEDVLVADDIKLDWTFRLSLLTDLVRGMRYLHGSALRVHGRLTSRNCAVDSRWVLRVTDYGLPALARAQGLPPSPSAARSLLWTAPELLRDEAARARGSQPGDVYSFAIIMQEVIVRGEPFCMLALSPDEIVEKLRRPPPLIRPSVSMGAAPPEAVSLMRQCWSEAPDLRPDFHRLHDMFRQLHRGRKVNIVDSMFEMLEKYSNNLEELIKERTEQLDIEKKKTEQLLNRMLPRAVAERLLLGQRVEPEEFAEVSVYFSDIVGFTALAARCTPVQVADLLNDLYSTFDAAIERYNVYKVETIGDAYMVVGGLDARPGHAPAVATMALHLLHLAGRFRVRHLPDTALRLRCGVHSGPVCAAVVGLTMPRYCLFGDTVNTASRMESTGAACRIQVSAATAALLAAAGGYRLRARGRVLVKGKGAMHTYWLLGKEGFDKPLPTPPSLPSEEVLLEAEAESEVAPEQLRAAEGSPARAAEGSPARAAEGSPARAAGDRGLYRRAGESLRRQWSLERGEALATAAAGEHALALLAGAPRAPPPRYRTRPDPPDAPV